MAGRRRIALVACRITACRLGASLTSAEDDRVDTDNDGLTVRAEQPSVIPSVPTCFLNTNGAYTPIPSKNWPMPPRTIRTPVTRLTMRLREGMGQ